MLNRPEVTDNLIMQINDSNSSPVVKYTLFLEKLVEPELNATVTEPRDVGIHICFG